MTSFRVERLRFDKAAVKQWGYLDERHTDWPVVYALNGANRIYVGETLDAGGRFRQHLDKAALPGLDTVRVVIDETFNKSACLDLESYLIKLFAGDGRYEVLNGNAGITDRNYFQRERYQRIFREIFDELTREGLFDHSIQEIENSDLFKLSPFKSLTHDQAIAVLDIMEGLCADLEEQRTSTIVVQGDPGTGKTIVGIFLVKLIRDIQSADPLDESHQDSLFSEFFVSDSVERLAGLRVGLVVPQQSLRDSIRKVFKRTPNLEASMVLTPFDVGASEEHFDVLIVDETHRLNQRANQASGMKNRQFADINRKLFGADDPALTQLDWIRAKSTHQVLLLDAAQSVRPADLPQKTTTELVDSVARNGRLYRLQSQMRVRAGTDYVDYIRRMLRCTVDEPRSFGEYEFLFFDDLAQMQRAIIERDQAHGLARLVAGYAWPWLSKKDKTAYDITIDGCQLRWNSAEMDWISSKGSVDEVGSIHTVQGYDLNYAGVIIGPDLRYDPVSGRPYFDRASYFDKKGKENNPQLGITYTDDDLLGYVINIYSVLLTRGMLGTFVYVADPELREYLRHFVG